MDPKTFYILVCLFTSLPTFVFCAQKYEHITDCRFHSRGNNKYGHDNVTFICAEINGENIVFPDPNNFNCSNFCRPVHFNWPGTINFENCRFNELKRNFFKDFQYVHTANLSDLGLEALQTDIFNQATKLTFLDVSKNNIKEIPSLIFMNAKTLTHVDFSCNKIVQIDAVAFSGATKIEHLDLSRNNLTHIKEHTFDKLSELKLLNLSFNSIGDLKIDTFIHLLKPTNTSSVQAGTLLHQSHLVTLDLSENALKTLDFTLHYPIQYELRTLNISKNQLSSLNGFRNSLFPQLTSLDIKNNRFNCTYLRHFMESINWEDIRLPIDSHSMNPQVSSIRGINCEVVAGQESSDDNSKSQHKSNDDILIKITLVLLCIIMLIFLIMYVTLNRKRIFDKSFCHWKKSISIGQTATEKVEYCKEELLLN
ncbi:uncharacterized protein LOC129567111 [Sitodiplosis mosellana]|uniref:uncharacterized protein LOC129567111 n=1 Tax=Sitodiplosis mosellana TaxID=263140 RepID=UPI0024441715|nr:uncharacterized protein LOC129567111 [Sitodiplosis mosellana]